MYISSKKERCVQMAEYMIENNSTVRKIANEFRISKSTVHKDITYTLKKVDPELYKKAKRILEINKQERHLRGGEATKMKFLFQKQQ